MILKNITINKNDSGQRLDKFILKIYKNLPKSKLYSSIRKKDIKLNGKKCAGNEMLSEGDTLRICLPDEFAEIKKEISKSSLSLNIVYEDDNIIIVNKQKNLDVQPSSKGADCAVSRLYSYLDFTPSPEHSFSPAFCNRLDRNTQGMLIAAKNAAALREINQCIRENKIHKKYIAVCVGNFKNKSGLLKNHHSVTSGNKVKISDIPFENSKETITEYKVLKSNANLSLVEINLITGRKHQIRAVLAHIGHPVLGDGKYGNSKINLKYKEKNQVLRAYELSFEPDENMSVSYLNGKTFRIDISDIEKKYF